MAAEEELGAQKYYYLYNAHGDVTALIDEQGGIAGTYDYDVFGNLISESGDANNNIMYSGYQYDKESGLYYLNARYYDSTIARFISEDSYRGMTNDPLSLNLYTYCYNNPIIYYDPTGHELVALKDVMDQNNGSMKINSDNTITITANKITKVYNKDDIVMFSGDVIMDDLLFKMDFNYNMGGLFDFRKKLKLDPEKDSIRAFNKKFNNNEELVNYIGTFANSLYDYQYQYLVEFTEDDGYIGLVYATSSLSRLDKLLSTNGNISKRDAYSVGISPDKISSLQVEFNLIQNGLSLAQMNNIYNQQRDEAFRQLLGYSLTLTTMNPGNMYEKNVPSDDDYVVMANGEKRKTSSFHYEPWQYTPSGNEGVPEDIVDGICFIGDTLIPTKDGYKEIKDIIVGDEVYSEKPDTGEKGLKKVKNVFVNETKVLIHVFVGQEVIKATPSHPFWIEGKGWVVASNLQVGDKVSLFNGNFDYVEKTIVEKLDEFVKVYNFEVEDWHTYYVSMSRILVHNKCSEGSNGVYENAPYHGKVGNTIKSKAPNDGQGALDNSVSISENTTRRIGVSSGEIVVLDETGNGVFHGHVRPWYELTNQMKSALVKGGLVDWKGNIIK